MYVPATAEGSHTWTGSHAKHAVLAVAVLAICPGKAMQTPSNQPALISSRSVVGMKMNSSIHASQENSSREGLIGIGDDAHAKQKSPSF